MTTPRLPRDDIAAAMAARHELGPDYDDAFVDTVVARLQESLQTRPPVATARARRTGGDRTVLLTVSSLLAAIPLTGIAAGTTGLPGLIVAWVGLVLINVAHALRRP
ncbi:hypothetical protein [Thermomonospora echinospora]|nr:hypothetical protein [Thermomonospora echinospora]